MPGFFPSGMPGIAELIDMAMQHAPHPFRHSIILNYFEHQQIKLSVHNFET
jgi:hypothetical protein